MITDTVERMRVADVEIIARLHARCFYDAWDSSMLRQILLMPGAFGLVACWGGRGSAIGFALGRIAADECELLSLGIAPEHRARGVGAKLLAASMDHATSEGATRFFLEVAEDNQPALKLYRAHGLAAVGRRPDYYENASGPRTAALTMRCDLPVVGTAKRAG